MKLVFAIDIAGQEHSRAKTLSLLRGITQRSAKLDVVTDITRGGNSSGEIRRPKLDLVKMRMHVPKTGNSVFPRGVEKGRIFGNTNLIARAYCCNDSILDNDDAVLHGRCTRRILERRARDRKPACASGPRCYGQL